MNANRKKKPIGPYHNLTAEAAYENAHLVAQDLVEHIRELLFDLPAPGNDEHPINWADVGSVNEVNNRLSSIVTFLDDTEE
tara:strand:- start:458 stop:700 length:243 start_codon:yes stop_codon:yes gene_type:complete